jgi:hypothetical protein
MDSKFSALITVMLVSTHPDSSRQTHPMRGGGDHVDATVRRGRNRHAAGFFNLRESHGSGIDSFSSIIHVKVSPTTTPISLSASAGDFPCAKSVGNSRQSAFFF